MAHIPEPWHVSIWLWFMHNYCMVLKHGYYLNIFYNASSAFTLDVHVIWPIAISVVFLTVLGNTHLHLKSSILADYQPLKRILRNARPPFFIPMHSLIVHYTVAASRLLQSGVALIAKCGGLRFITA